MTTRMVIAALLLGSAALPAQADVTTHVQSRIDEAMQSVKSFAVTTLDPAQAYSATLVHVAPDRSRLVVAIAASTTDVVTVGDTTYSSKNGAPFEKVVLSADAGTRLRALGSVKVGALYPDVSVDGVTYGAFQTTVALGAAESLRCTYDKKSFRLVRCANGDVTQTYSGYDDPGNVVEAPKAAIEVPPSVSGDH